MDPAPSTRPGKALSLRPGVGSKVLQPFGPSPGRAAAAETMISLTLMERVRQPSKKHAAPVASPLKRLAALSRVRATCLCRAVACCPVLCTGCVFVPSLWWACSC